MVRVTGTPGPPPVLTTIRVEGRLPLRPGDEVTIARLGRARYRGHQNADGSIDVFYKGRCRSVTLDRITTVHRKEKMR